MNQSNHKSQLIIFGVVLVAVLLIINKRQSNNYNANVDIINGKVMSGESSKNQVDIENEKMKAIEAFLPNASLYASEEGIKTIVKHNGFILKKVIVRPDHSIELVIAGAETPPLIKREPIVNPAKWATAKVALMNIANGGVYKTNEHDQQFIKKWQAMQTQTKRPSP